MKYAILMVLVFFALGCDKDDDSIINPSVESTLYFPPLNSDEWECKSPSELGWNISELGGLLTYLETVSYTH